MTTWQYNHLPAICSSGVVGGPFERRSPYSGYFDRCESTLRMNEVSFEDAAQHLMESSISTALEKGKRTSQQVDALLLGDLINQLTPSTFAARSINIPYLGLFSACATSMQGLALAGALVDAGYCDSVLTGVSSHNAAVEKQFRYPTEYGGQKPPSAQWTVTGAGTVLVEKSADQALARIQAATIGRVTDLGRTDPFDMGTAMAPAAAAVIDQHLTARGQETSAYDVIVTGDLAWIGHRIAEQLLHQKGRHFTEGQFEDCGKLIYAGNSEVQAGASGPACSAMMVYGYYLDQLKTGKIKRLLAVATGALLSPLTFQQGKTIPCIAHAVELISPHEVNGGE